MNKKFTKSVVSGAELIQIFSLGELYNSDFLKPGEQTKYEKCELKLGFDPVSKVVQLMEQPPDLFGSFYWYLSQTNPSMCAALKDLAEKTINCIPRGSSENGLDIFLDIASNDGTLLSYVPFTFQKIGIDPSKYTPVPDCGMLVRDYFSAKTYYSVLNKKARFISCAAMFYDLESPESFLRDVYEILEDDGIFTLQLSYTPLMLIQTEIGNLCFEHLCFYNLSSLKYLFDKTGFKIKDVELNNVNGGSIRVYLQKESARNFKTPADNDIARIRINSLLYWEEEFGFNDIEYYKLFYKKILSLKEKTMNFLKQEKAKGKTIYGYGASTKSAVLYGFFGIDNTLVSKIAEKQERKVGLETVNGRIPIISDEQMRLEQPDYLLVGPWFFLENFKQREKEYLDKGGAFILTSPEFSIYKNI